MKEVQAVKQMTLLIVAIGGLAATAGHCGERAMDMRVFEINAHLLAYYDGRPPEPSKPMASGTWDDTGAYDVGVCTYVIHDGDEALVYDTYPDVRDAAWVRKDLERRGIKRFTVVNSHWHLDHVGGNAVYADSSRIATMRTIDKLKAKKAGIEAGTEWGPPAIRPLVLPTIGIDHDTTVTVGRIGVLLRPVNIHSADGLVALVPDDHLLLAGDTLEDTVTFISEPEGINEHLANLQAMKGWGIARILPNHGDPERIRGGGYPPTLIDATIAYLSQVRHRVGELHDQGGTLEDYVHDSVERGWVSIWWAYHAAHAENVRRVAQGAGRP